MKETLKLYEDTLKEVMKIHPNIERSERRKIALSLVGVISERENVENLIKYHKQGGK